MTQGPAMTLLFSVPNSPMRSNKAKVVPYLPACSVHPKSHGGTLKQAN